MSNNAADNQQKIKLENDDMKLEIKLEILNKKLENEEKQKEIEESKWVVKGNFRWIVVFSVVTVVSLAISAIYSAILNNATGFSIFAILNNATGFSIFAILNNIIDFSISLGIALVNIIFLLSINGLLLLLVKSIFDAIERINGNEKSISHLKDYINYSSIIGLVERFVYVIGIWTQNYELITVVVAVKTFMRFNSVKASSDSDTSGDKVTAEKYILGTLLNLLFSFVIVWLFKR